MFFGSGAGPCEQARSVAAALLFLPCCSYVQALGVRPSPHRNRRQAACAASHLPDLHRNRLASFLVLT